MKEALPDDFDPRTVCLSVDVDWASPDVIADLRSLFDERGLKATFFVTHAGVEVPGHERGIHPNFRRNGDVMRTLESDANGARLDEAVIYPRLVAAFKSFAPEAKGVRAHSLYYDSMLLPTYQELGFEYDSTYQIPLVRGLRPFWKEYDILEIPVYFNDHFELKSNAVGFDASNLKLDEAGLKVILLHPNIMFLNATSNEQYLACKSFYHDYERLLHARHGGRGVRSLALDLLDSIVAQKLPVLTLGEVSERWRHVRKWR
jgi:peptidoglycan/xylan/chitin deacetylase (PgdA/CDA1 family)